MLATLRLRWILRTLVGAGLSFVLVFTFQLSLAQAATLLQLSTDPTTNGTSQHQTEVEPDTFSSGSTIVSAFQVGRFTDGGGSNAGWATSTDNGTTWTNGFLPGTTPFSTPTGAFQRVSDPTVAFDARHNVWFIATLGIVNSTNGQGPIGNAVLISRSTNGGLTWNNPVIAAQAGQNVFLDKDWIVCDNTSTSAFFGNCYIEYDNVSSSDLIRMRRSTDGGLTWSGASGTGDNAHGLGGQPVVQPNGTVIVPYQSTSGQIRSFRSTNGGASWSSSVLISSISDHAVAGGLRSEPLPSAEIDGAGKVFVVWHDCRFESGCTANDIVLSTSTNGTTWTAVQRIPIDAVGSNVDHFIPGIGVDKSTSGSTARIGLTFYFYPAANCSASTCQLNVGFVSSNNGGTTWSARNTLTSSPMTLSWLANTTQGPMVGDYISTSFANAKAFPVFMVATAPTGGTFHEAAFTVVGGLPV